MPSDFIRRSELRASVSMSPDQTFKRPADVPLVIKSVNIRMNKETWFAMFSCYLRTVPTPRMYIPIFDIRVLNFHKGASWKGRQFWPREWVLWIKTYTQEVNTEIEYLIEWEPEPIIEKPRGWRP